HEQQRSDRCREQQQQFLHPRPPPRVDPPSTRICAVQIGRGRGQTVCARGPVLLVNHLARGGFAMRPLYAVVVGASTLALVAAGCGGAIPAGNGGPATLKLTSTQQGRFLVDGQGHSLYL